MRSVAGVWCRPALAMLSGRCQNGIDRCHTDGSLRCRCQLFPKGNGDLQQIFQASLTLAKPSGFLVAADMGLSLLLGPQVTAEVVPLRGLLSDARLLLAVLLAHVCDRGMPSVFACMPPPMDA